MEPCRIYWGSHGCTLERGHEGGHFCCCDCPGDSHPWGIEGHPDVKCVGKAPYYGPEIATNFYGEDALT